MLLQSIKHKWRFVALILIIISLASLAVVLGYNSTPDETDPETQKTTTASSAETTIETTVETTRPTYLVGTVKDTHGGTYLYVYADKSNDAKIVGATVLGKDFLITEYGEQWSKISFVRGVSGYVPTDVLTVSQTSELPRFYPSYFFLPATEEMGYNHKAFNNRLVIEEIIYTEDVWDEEEEAFVEIELTRLKVKTTTGTVLSEDATIVLVNATITAPPLLPEEPDPDATPAPSPTPSPTPVPDEGEEETAEPSLAPSPTPVPVEIKIRNGKITSMTGIELDEDVKPLKNGKYGQLMTEDETVIIYNDTIIPDAEYRVVDGYILYYDKIAGEPRDIIIETGYYFLPALLIDQLVDIRRYSDDIRIDQLFSQNDENNIAGGNVYVNPACFIQRGTLDKLLRAQEIFAENGYTIVVYDAYRPYSVTLILHERHRDGRYVAGPRFGSVHNKGAAIDMSLINEYGRLVEMPSPIHTLNATSHRNCPSMTPTAKQNMEYMASVMATCGFTTISTEWWHFNDTDNEKYLRTDHDLPALYPIITGD